MHDYSQIKGFSEDEYVDFLGWLIEDFPEQLNTYNFTFLNELNYDLRGNKNLQVLVRQFLKEFNVFLSNNLELLELDVVEHVFRIFPPEELDLRNVSTAFKGITFSGLNSGWKLILDDKEHWYIDTEDQRPNQRNTVCYYGNDINLVYLLKEHINYEIRSKSVTFDMVTTEWKYSNCQTLIGKECEKIIFETCSPYNIKNAAELKNKVIFEPHRLTTNKLGDILIKKIKGVE